MEQARERFPPTWKDENSFEKVAENFIEELEKRGYDTKTLKFEVKLRVGPNPEAAQ